jgi:hypothetical protein
MFPQLTEQDVYALSTVQLHPLGSVFFLPTVQGKKGFRYVSFGGTSAIAAGLLLVAAAAPTNSTGLAISAANLTAALSAGSRQLIITNGATAVTQNQFADGQLEILGTNGGFTVTIAGNTSAAASGAITVTLAEPLVNTTALANGTNTVNLRQSSSSLAVASLTQSNPVGVTIRPVANSATVTNYGFVQISGPGFVFATTATKGYPVVQDTAGTAGYIANTGSNLPQIGIAQESVASNMASVNLMLN